MNKKSDQTYSTKVLLGNWVEDRIECPKVGTLYYPPNERIDYEKLKPQSRQFDFRQNKLSGVEGNVKSVIHHDSHKNCNNYATVNDLVYNHQPKPLCGPIQRYYRRCKHNFYPQPDLMKCSGNVTEWGLRKYLQHEWACTDVYDYSSTFYDDTYVAPQPHQYLQRCERRARNSIPSSRTKHFASRLSCALPMNGVICVVFPDNYNLDLFKARVNWHFLEASQKLSSLR